MTNTTNTADLRAALAAPAQAVPAPGAPCEPSITLDFKMATELLKMFGEEPGLVTLQHGSERSHSGTGLYALYSHLPEEGAEFLGAEPDNKAMPEAAAGVTAAPAQAGEYPELPEGLVGSILGAAYDFRDAHLAGSKNLKCSAHVEFEATVITALRAARGAAQSAPVDAAVQQDAERWQFFADYMVSTRTDLDDEIVGCDSVQKMARVIDAARQGGAA